MTKTDIRDKGRELEERLLRALGLQNERVTFLRLTFRPHQPIQVEATFMTDDQRGTATLEALTEDLNSLDLLRGKQDAGGV